MIRTAGPDRMERHPWEHPRELAALGFAVVWTTGPDPRRDGVFRVAALRRGEEGSWERLDRFATPCADAADPEAGVTRAQLADAPSQEEAFAELLDFLGDRPFVVPERAAFAGWAERLAPERRAGRVVGLAEMATLLVPRRLSPRQDALDPESLQGALAELVARTLALDEPVLATLAHGFEEAWLRLHESQRSTADELAFHLALCEHPSLWSAGASGLFVGGGKLEDGRLTAAFDAFADLEGAADAARPRWGAAARGERKIEPLPTRPDEPVVLTESDRRLVDQILEEHLPRHFAGDHGSGEDAPSYRPGQHAVAAEIARSFGEEGMLLVHAPTGTGKTLAYLVPTLLWAFRNGVRVGVATFTRALQEQALDRDVPLALELLRRAGVDAEGELRVSLLKGRRNYLCWRALRLQAPTPMDPHEEWLAWTSLALFALTDEHGDLDRFPRRTPLELADPSAYRDSVVRLTMLSRSESGCCSLREDRENCAGAASRRRAERAHVVITNHAFALQRREFFRHMVFDECEHLHGQAHSAFSHVIPFRHLRDTLLSLHEPGRGRRPLSRIREIAVPDSEAAECVRACIESVEEALGAADALQRAVFDFKTWREDVRGTRDERDLHSLFREFVLEHGSGPLLQAHLALTRALGELAASLAEMSEHLDTLPSRGILRIRRALEVLRLELDELYAGVEAWIPRDAEQPFFRPETFYDLETTPGGYDVMAARVLLPHEHLGRNYYPELAGAVLISATTWLRGGFESAAVYLGLERAARPAEDERRPPVPLRTFRAPEVFDYSRVLVAVPRDAPSLRTSKRAFLDYVARFVTQLGERTRGRMLVLFTNGEDCVRTGREVEGFFAERRIPFWYQRMDGAAKEELSELFRSRVDSVLFGLDTFWYGADFPGETLEYLVIVRLPYGVPDRYHHAQCAALGNGEQRRSIYMPRALAKLRQGFGRLMRKESDKGCVFVLDGRILEPRHRVFLQELPIRAPLDRAGDSGAGASFVRGDTDRCLREALAHMDMLSDMRRPAVPDEDVPY